MKRRAQSDDESCLLTGAIGAMPIQSEDTFLNRRTFFWPMQIKEVKAREILDSRGWPTVEVSIKCGEQWFTAAAPSGASTGKHEVWELRDGGKRFLGRGVLNAVDNVNLVIARKIRGVDCIAQREIDELMIKLDGTANKSKLGANAILGVSLAAARAGAFASGKELWQYLGQLAGNKKFVLPTPFFNVINGGKHAGNNLSFQEFMIAPSGKSFAEQLKMGAEFYQILKLHLSGKYGKTAINVGDEGGFAPAIDSAEEALNILEHVQKETGYGGRIKLAMDCAASDFYENKVYYLTKDRKKKMGKEELLNYYINLVKKYKLISIEDPFHEEDFVSYAELLKKSKIQIVTDDLTVTNVKRLREAIKQKSGNCLLLKVNQIGTLTEALEAAKMAKQDKWKVMVSHRSGETNDSFIADLAVGLGCRMIKAGAPCRGERLAKYNRLMKIEEKLEVK